MPDAARRALIAALILIASGVALAPAAGPALGAGLMILDGGGESTSTVFDRIAAEVPPGGRLCLIDTGTSGLDRPERLFAAYPDLRVEVLRIDEAAARRAKTAASLRSCDAYFFNGGDPEALSRAFTRGGKGTPALDAVREQVEGAGILFSGSSAGAMIAGGLTLCECSAKSSVTALTEGKLFQAPGFDFIDGVLIDAHFFARGLLGRHFYALALNGIPIGVGINEGTAVAVPRGGGPWEVLGDGGVALIYAPHGAKPERLRGFSVSLLSSGDLFDPRTGKVTIAAERRPLNLAFGGEPLLFQDAFAPDRVRAIIERLTQSGASEATATVRGAKLSLTFRKTEKTRAYSDGRSFTVLGVQVSIEQPQA